MKIKKLILENINSLYGRWEIDFESPAFEDGLFAIIGPTGSGKSTILDAISMALFAETPRISGGTTKLLETVSKGASSSLAELTFEINGNIYRAAFGFSAYTRGAEKGKLNAKSGQHTLACGDKYISTKATDTQREITQLLGMKAEQFYRAVLLAQGKFDAFLTAKEKKADILEQITGTEIYSKIAKKINEKTKIFSDEIKQQEAKLDGLQLLSEQEETERRTRLGELEIRLNEFQQKQKLLETQQTLAENLIKTEEELKKICTQLENLKKEQEEFKPQADRLAAGKKAANIQPVFQSFSETGKKQQDAQTEFQKTQEKLPELEKQCNEAEKIKNSKETILQNCQKVYDALEETLKKVTPLDKEISEKTVLLAEKKNQHTNILTSTKTASSQKTEKQKELEKLETDNLTATTYLCEHKADAELSEQMANWTGEFTVLQQQKKLFQTTAKQQTECQQAEKKAQAEALKAQKQLETERKNTENTAKDVQKYQAELQEILQGVTKESLEKEEEHLNEIILLKSKIHSMQEERKSLVQGKPCPLCGSTEHPYAIGNIPEISEDQQNLKNIKQKLSACGEAEKKVTETQTKHTLAKTNLEHQQKQCDDKNKAAEEKKLQCEKIAQLLAEQEKDIRCKTENLQTAFRRYNITWDNFEELPPELSVRIETFKNATKQKNDFEQQKSIIRTELESLDKKIKTHQTEANELEKEQTRLNSELEIIRQTRRELLGDKNPDEERIRFQKQRDDAQESSKNAALEAAAVKNNFQHVKQQQEKLYQEIAGRQTVLEKQKQEFLEACRKEDMTPDSFKMSCLDPKELTSLTQAETRLQTDLRTAAEAQVGLIKKLEELRPQLPPEIRLDILQEELLGIKDQTDRLNQEKGGISQELKINETNRKNRKKQLDELDKLNANFQTWEMLNKLIGGADAQGFRRYAQGITLDHLLANANQLLQRMNSRYELIQSTQDILGIDVIDHLQGSEIRPSSNLSGGERFQVSLALALALSSMAGEKIRIDSLFLDEGFGTLDSNSLETALQTLTDLRREENKTIGIISHVQAIAENLPAQITVTPIGGGRSRLDGAGINKKTDKMNI